MKISHCFPGTKEQISVAKSLIEDIIENYERAQMYLDSALARREPRLPPKSSESPKPTPDSPRSERISPLPGICCRLFRKQNYFAAALF